MVILSKLNITDNSKLGESQGRKTTGLKACAMIAGLPKRKQRMNCMFRHTALFFGEMKKEGK